MAQYTLTFNNTTYTFDVFDSKSSTKHHLTEAPGTVMINGEDEYILNYSYLKDDAYTRASYELFNINNQVSVYKQFAERDFPFHIVSSMVEHIIKREKIPTKRLGDVENYSYLYKVNN